MSRNRYNLIRKFFYLNHARPEDHINGKLRDKFHKIHPMLDLCNKTFKENWKLSRHVAIDEMMWYGRKHCPARAYMPSKPDKFGIKAWALNDNHTGYLYDFWPCGAGGTDFPMTPMSCVHNLATANVSTCGILGIWSETVCCSLTATSRPPLPSLPSNGTGVLWFVAPATHFAQIFPSRSCIGWT